MKLKTVLAVGLLGTVFLSSASGCNITDFGSDNLLRPPKTTGDEAEIEQLIADTANDKYTLKYPKSGAYRSAIIMCDLDGDKTEEAIAFFRKGNDITRIHMLVMYSDNGKWKLSADCITETTDVDCVEFADINGSKTLEIIVGYTTYTPNTNYLSCFTYSKGKTFEIKSGQNYSSFYCGDFNADGKNEIMTLTLYSAENEATATMLEYNDKNNTVYAKSAVPMDPNIIKYRNVLISDIGEGTKGIIVDSEFPSTELCTQVIYYNKELSLLRNPLYREKSKNISLRGCCVISSDVDGDLITEFPSVTKLPYSKNEPVELIADCITWNNFSSKNETVVPKYSVIANYNFNYTVKIQNKWTTDTVTAVHNNNENTTSFYEWNKNALGEKLFDIRAFDVSEWDKGIFNDEYTLIYKDNRYAYTFKNYDTKSQLALTDDEIKKSFSILSETIV